MAELKERVLEILKFNEPRDPRAQSLIYRYAIFTPGEEEMKAILALNPKERLQTLYKVLRIEDYKIARDNTQLVVTACNTKAAILEASGSDLETKRAELISLGDEIRRTEQTITNTRVEEGQVQNELDALNERLDDLRGRKELLPKQGQKNSEPTTDCTCSTRYPGRATELPRATKELCNAGTQEIEGLRQLKKPTEQDERSSRRRSTR